MQMYLGTQIALTGLVMTIFLFFVIVVYAEITNKKTPHVITMAIVLGTLLLSIIAMPVGAIIRIWT